MSENLWYVCMYCRRAYQERERLIEHKKANHLEAFLARKEARWRERNNLPPKIAVVHPRTSEDPDQDETVVDQNEATEENMETDQDQDRSPEGQENLDEEIDTPVQEDEDNDEETDNDSPGESDNEHEETVDSEAETLDSETARAETEEDFYDDDAENPGPVSPLTPPNSVPPPAAAARHNESASSDTSDDSDKTVLINNATELVQDHTQLSSSSSAIAGSVQPATEDPTRQPAIKMRLKRSAKSTYSIDRSIKCPKCSKSFKNLIGLNVHTRTIHGDKKSGGNVKTKCSFCNRIFVSSSALYLHVRVHNKNLQGGQLAQGQSTGTLGVESTGGPSTETTDGLGGTLAVESAGTSGVNSAETLESQATKEDNNGSDTWFYQSKFGDGIRPTTAIKRAALARQRNSKAEKYKCDHCDLEFTSPTSLMVHRRSHKFNCKYCYKSFDTLEQAEDHKRLHTFDRTLLCPYCPKTFAYPSPLAKHVAKNHPDGAVAEEPGPSTRSQTAAARSPAHAAEYPAASSQHPAASLRPPAPSAQPSRPVQRISKRIKRAQVTGKVPTTKILVKHSMRRQRKKILPEDVTCSFCGKIFKKKHQLRAHESVHTGVRQYKCKYCPRDFIHKSEMLVHEGFHERGGQLFSCSLCKAGFRRKGYLVTHLKTKHSLDEDKAKILASLKASAAAAGPTVGNVLLRARPPPKVVEDEREKAISQILVDGLVQYECCVCSGRFSHKTDILAHVHYDHGL